MLIMNANGDCDLYSPPPPALPVPLREITSAVQVERTTDGWAVLAVIRTDGLIRRDVIDTLPTEQAAEALARQLLREINAEAEPVKQKMTGGWHKRVLKYRGKAFEDHGND